MNRETGKQIAEILKPFLRDDVELEAFLVAQHPDDEKKDHAIMMYSMGDQVLALRILHAKTHNKGDTA